MAAESGDSFRRAKNLLIGAVDTIIKIADKKGEEASTQNARGSRAYSSSGSLVETASRSGPSRQRISDQEASSSVVQSAGLKEHQRLFAFKPSKGTSKRSKKTGKQPGRATWKKDCICLRDSGQTWRPSAEEKMKLAKMGLGLKEAVFNIDGDAAHIHSVLTTRFPVLDKCGGYTLLRLADSSRTLLEIETPDGGMSVSYLKDILNQAKLFIRPLQCDITMEDVKPFILSDDEDINEPSEFCRNCDLYFPLSQLRKHVTTCVKHDSKENSSILSVADDKEPSPAPPPAKRPRQASSRSVSLPESSSRYTLEDCFSEPPSPPIEPLSPNIQERVCGSSTYSSFINLIEDSDSDWEKDPAVQEILQASNERSEGIQNSDDLTAETLIKQHRTKLLYEDKYKALRITVRRGHIFDDTLKVLRLNFDEKQHIRVTFLGEAAVDDGGPRREFFMLLMGAISNNSSLLDGPPDRRILRHNTSAFQDELYLMIGKMIALSILHGGPGPVFFACTVVDYLFGGITMVRPCVDDIPDEHLKQKIHKLANTDKEEEFKALMGSEEYEFRYNCGVSKPAVYMSLSEKEKVVDALTLHYTVMVSLAELEQLRRGFTIQKFDSLLKSYPDVIRKCFQPPQCQITSSYIQDLFKPEFSPKGSNKRETEEAIIMTWIYYLQNLELHQSEGSPTLKDVMVFLTGCDSIPPLGFGDVDPCIVFRGDIVLPTISTCSMTLRFPSTFPQDFDAFKEKMDLAILGSHGFFGQL